MLLKMAGKQCSTPPIIVVSGLPRSGTSMMMQMLEAGGIEVFSDHLRRPDADNPKGYYEHERVKELDQNKRQTWLGAAQGKAVKVISQLLKELPHVYFYKIIFMNRDLQEVLASQNKMLARRGQPSDGNCDEKLRLLFEKHVKEIKHWLGQQANFEVIEVEYREVVNNPAESAASLSEFLETKLNLAKMTRVVDEKFYRNKI
jgi:hypothetical protein